MPAVRASSALLALCATTFASLCAADPAPRIPRSTIPTDLAPEVRTLIEDLYHNDMDRHLGAIRELAKLGAAAASAAPYLASMLDNDNKIARGCAVAVKTLSALGPHGVEAMLTTLQIGRRRGRDRALEILTAVQDARAIPTLIGMAADDGADSRAGLCLAAHGAPARALVLEQLGHADADIRRQAVRAAAVFADAAMAERLTPLLADAAPGIARDRARPC